MNPSALFDIIHASQCTTLANFYHYLQYFQQKVFNFSKISGSQTEAVVSVTIFIIYQLSK